MGAMHEFPLRVSKGRYALLAMLRLAQHDPHTPLSLAAIARSENVSLPYLEQLFSDLKKGGLVKGYRGPRGGYRLAKPADRISFAEVIHSVSNGSDQQDAVHHNDDTPANGAVAPDGMWDLISRELFQYLDRISLNEFLQRPEVASLNGDDGQEHQKSEPVPGSVRTHGDRNARMPLNAAANDRH